MVWWWIVPAFLTVFGVISLNGEDDGFPSAIFLLAAACILIGHFL